MEGAGLAGQQIKVSEARPRQGGAGGGRGYGGGSRGNQLYFIFSRIKTSTFGRVYMFCISYAFS